MRVYKSKDAILSVLLVVIGALGLYACWGESPAATPRATVPAPTAPTATAVAAASTEASRVPTAAPGQPTTVSEQPAAATRETPANDTSDSSTSGNSSDSAMDLLKRSSAAMKSVKSYHVLLRSESSRGSATTEGDVVLPDKERLVIDSGPSGKSEIVIIGQDSYMKLPGTNSYNRFSLGASPLGVANNIAGFADIAENPIIVGDENMEGVDATHVKFTYSLEKALEMAAGEEGKAIPTSSVSMGKADGDAWIEKATGYIRVLTNRISLDGAPTTTTVIFSNFDEDVNPPIEKPAP